VIGGFVFGLLGLTSWNLIGSGGIVYWRGHPLLVRRLKKNMQRADR
jgi:hypothetical protein